MRITELTGVRITHIETVPLKVKLERAAVGSTLKLTHRCTIVTRVHTDAGVVGECFNGNDDELQASILRMIHEEMAPRLVGQRVVAIEDAWAVTRRAGAGRKRWSSSRARVS